MLDDDKRKLIATCHSCELGIDKNVNLANKLCILYKFNINLSLPIIKRIYGRKVKLLSNVSSSIINLMSLLFLDEIHASGIVILIE